MNLPESFHRQMQSLLGNNTEAFEQALHDTPPVSIRINRSPKFPLQNPFETLSKVPWCNTGYYLPARPVFTLDPLFHAGAYYAQEAASMYVEQCINHILKEDNSPKIVLDLCAAPGGKSTHLASLLPEGSLLVSNEIIRSRANILCENLAKWGFTNVVITNNDPIDFNALPNFFDIILTDVPCSGEGMFRKDTDSINEWSVNNVQLCAERQQRITANVWDALKPNGHLIYSTCTYNTAENESNIQYLINNFGVTSIPINNPAEWGIASSFQAGVNACRFFPHCTKSEGFFIALLQKPDEHYTGKGRYKNEKNGFQKLNKKFEQVTTWVKPTQEWNFIQNGNIISALPHEHISKIETINRHLRMLSAGVRMGEVKGNDIIPDAALALSAAINTNNFATWNVDTETALKYLRRNNLIVPNAEKGYVLITVDGIPLGWIKNLGARSNNLYPAEWRIKHL